MRRHKTSVLLVNTKEKGNKVRQVPTHVVMHWRKYLLFFFFLFAALMVVSGLMIYQNTSRQYKDKLARANYIRNQIDIKKAKAAFSSIDSSMYRINSFLQERGLEEMEMKNVGGGSDFEITDINDVADFYNKQVNNLENTLESIPLGNPYDGEVTSDFGYRRNPFTGRGAEFHPGMDFKGKLGDTIRTMGGGLVVYAGFKAGYGRCVIVQHRKNLETLYGHLHRIHVAEGQRVETGQMIGTLGNSGRSTGPHLHYEIICGDKKINPEDYLSFYSEEENNDRKKR